MNRPKIKFITYIYILYYQFNFHLTWLFFWIFGIKADITEERQISALNVKAIRDQRHANVSKQTTLLHGVDVGPPKWRVGGRGLNRPFPEAMNYISNVKVHFRPGPTQIRLHNN